ncbi:hypothetical protein MRB53_015000 [Persea americana]|uniref:Uncharacterized protein n=1 Tax=Persea americana TaxID=3435 RepID=A0ACC2KCG9_PERAE|nr:hypothetical protein MRB53_015000 [Persea americana]
MRKTRNGLQDDSIRETSLGVGDLLKSQPNTPSRNGVFRLHHYISSDHVCPTLAGTSHLLNGHDSPSSAPKTNTTSLTADRGEEIQTTSFTNEIDDTRQEMREDVYL